MSKQQKKDKKSDDPPVPAPSKDKELPTELGRRKLKKMGGVVKAAAARTIGDWTVEQWQRLPKQILHELSQKDKTPKPIYRSCKVRKGINTLYVDPGDEDPDDAESSDDDDDVDLNDNSDNEDQDDDESEKQQTSSYEYVSWEKQQELEAAKCRWRFKVVLPDAKNKEKDQVIETLECYRSKEEAQEMAALLALFIKGPTIPHENKLPEPFKARWLTLANNHEQTVKQANAKPIKNQSTDDVVQAPPIRLPVTLATKFATKQQARLAADARRIAFTQRCRQQETNFLSKLAQFTNLMLGDRLRDNISEMARLFDAHLFKCLLSPQPSSSSSLSSSRNPQIPNSIPKDELTSLLHPSHNVKVVVPNDRMTHTFLDTIPDKLHWNKIHHHEIVSRHLSSYLTRIGFDQNVIQQCLGFCTKFMLIFGSCHSLNTIASNNVFQSADNNRSFVLWDSKRVEQLTETLAQQCQLWDAQNNNKVFNPTRNAASAQIELGSILAAMHDRTVLLSKHNQQQPTSSQQQQQFALLHRLYFLALSYISIYVPEHRYPTAFNPQAQQLSATNFKNIDERLTQLGTQVQHSVVPQVLTSDLFGIHPTVFAYLYQHLQKSSSSSTNVLHQEVLNVLHKHDVTFKSIKMPSENTIVIFNTLAAAYAPFIVTIWKNFVEQNTLLSPDSSTSQQQQQQQQSDLLIAPINELSQFSSISPQSTHLAFRPLVSSVPSLVKPCLDLQDISLPEKMLSSAFIPWIMAIQELLSAYPPSHSSVRATVENAHHISIAVLPPVLHHNHAHNHQHQTLNNNPWFVLDIFFSSCLTQSAASSFTDGILLPVFTVRDHLPDAISLTQRLSVSKRQNIVLSLYQDLFVQYGSILRQSQQISHQHQVPQGYCSILTQVVKRFISTWEIASLRPSYVTFPPCLSSAYDPKQSQSNNTTVSSTQSSFTSLPKKPSAQQAIDFLRYQCGDRAFSLSARYWLYQHAITISGRSDARIHNQKAQLSQKMPNPFKMFISSTKKIAASKSQQLLDKYQQYYANDVNTTMIEQRAKLPAVIAKESIVSTVANHDICIIRGETGCGKSTSIPQLILDDFITSNRGGECLILCTQPRRISAIGLADRVATERGEQVGETIGYKVKLEQKTSAETKIIYLTVGVLLRQLMSVFNAFAQNVDAEPSSAILNGVTHIIVDEVHERSVDIDFLLLLLKLLMIIRQSSPTTNSSSNQNELHPPLKVVLMSATVDTTALVNYFQFDVLQTQNHETSSSKGSKNGLKSTYANIQREYLQALQKYRAEAKHTDESLRKQEEEDINLEDVSLDSKSKKNRDGGDNESAELPPVDVPDVSAVDDQPAHDDKKSKKDKKDKKSSDKKDKKSDKKSDKKDDKSKKATFAQPAATDFDGFSSFLDEGVEMSNSKPSKSSQTSSKDNKKSASSTQTKSTHSSNSTKIAPLPPSEIPILNIPGRTFPVQVHYLPELLSDLQDDWKPQFRDLTAQQLNQLQSNVNKLRQIQQEQSSQQKKPARIIDDESILMDAVRFDAASSIDMKLVEAAVWHVCRRFPSFDHGAGAILVFLPGAGEISQLQRNLLTSARQGRCSVTGVLTPPLRGLTIMQLHGSLPAAEQRQALQLPPRGTRKILLCTNVAETSLSVPDCEYVIDCGREKSTQADAEKRMSILRLQWCAQANCEQRTGRAGRIRPGHAWRLFSQHHFEATMPRFATPEMHRVLLDDVILTTQIMGLGALIQHFQKVFYPLPNQHTQAFETLPLALSAMIDPPRIANVIGSIQELTALQALETTSLQPTALGQMMSQLPVSSPRIAKLMIFGTLMKCSTPMVVLAAIMSEKSPFLPQFITAETIATSAAAVSSSKPTWMSSDDEQDDNDDDNNTDTRRTVISRVKRQDKRHVFYVQGSDHLTLINVYNQYIAFKTKCGGKISPLKNWCDEHGLNWVTMASVEKTAKQYLLALKSAGLIPQVKSTHRSNKTPQQQQQQKPDDTNEPNPDDDQDDLVVSDLADDGGADLEIDDVFVDEFDQDDNVSDTESLTTLPSGPDAYDLYSSIPSVVVGALTAGLYPHFIHSSQHGSSATDSATNASVPALFIYDRNSLTKSESKEETDDETTTKRRHLPRRRVFVHPSSVNATTKHYKTPYLMYTTLHATNKPYVMDLTSAHPHALMIMAQESSLFHLGYAVTLDHVIQMRPHGIKIPILLMLLQEQFLTLIDYVVKHPKHMSLLFESPFVQALALVLATGGY